MTVGDDPGVRVFARALGGVTGLVLALWIGGWMEAPDWMVAVWAVVLAVALAWLARRMLVSPRGTLRWTGREWLWLEGDAAGTNASARSHAADAAPVGHVRLMLDLGGWMLLRFEPYLAGNHPCPGDSSAPRGGAMPRLRGRTRALWLPLGVSAAKGSWRWLRALVHARRSAIRASTPGAEPADR